MESLANSMKRRIVILSIALLVAAVHVVGGRRFLQDDAYLLYASYFSDLALPFTFYFLLCMAEFNVPGLHHWAVKAAVVFLMAAAAETCQYFGVAVLGATFDPLDYGMYALGAALAALVERQVFARVFKFWRV
jgi:hypothetical protein